MFIELETLIAQEAKGFTCFKSSTKHIRQLPAIDNFSWKQNLGTSTLFFKQAWISVNLLFIVYWKSFNLNDIFFIYVFCFLLLKARNISKLNKHVNKPKLKNALKSGKNKEKVSLMKNIKPSKITNI